MSARSAFYLRPGENERVETLVTLRPDTRSALYGIVCDPDGVPVRDALILVYETGVDDGKGPIRQCFTDGDGAFAIGPLTAGTLYLVKVYQNDVMVRALEVMTE